MFQNILLHSITPTPPITPTIAAKIIQNHQSYSQTLLQILKPCKFLKIKITSILSLSDNINNGYTIKINHYLSKQIHIITLKAETPSPGFTPPPITQQEQSTSNTHTYDYYPNQISPFYHSKEASLTLYAFPDPTHAPWQTIGSHDSKSYGDTQICHDEVTHKSCPQLSFLLCEASWLLDDDINQIYVPFPPISINIHVPYPYYPPDNPTPSSHSIHPITSILSLFYPPLPYLYLCNCSHTEEYLIYQLPDILLMSQSVASRASNASSKMLEEIANRSQAKIYRVEGTFSDQQMRVIWNALGLYISRNLRMGRGVFVPRLGTFTFTPPQVRLQGVTNQEQRDLQPRTPVFLIQKQFIKGLPLRAALFYHQDFGAGLRPYSATGSTGEVPVAKMNLIEVSSYANMSKDATELGITRIIKYLQQKLISGDNLSLELPSLGQLVCRNRLVAVKFNQYLLRDTRNVLAKSVDERKLRGNMSLTTDNLKKFANLTDLSQKLAGKTQQFFQIDDKAKMYLSNNFNLHIDNTNMKRSVTNFDRSVASRLFDKTNKSLKDSHINRLTQSGFFPGHPCASKQFNLALRFVRQWVRDHGYNSTQSYFAFCTLAGKRTQVLTSSDVWNACKQISADITEQQGQELFRILDNNKDGLITVDDWRNNVHFDHNHPKFTQLLTHIKQHKLTISKVLAILGLEGVRKVSLYNLKDGLLRLWPAASEQDALLLSKFIAKGKDEVQVQRVMDALNIRDEGPVQADRQWQTRFFIRLKRKLHQHNILEEQLSSKFHLYDKNNNGYIEQTDFKIVLAQLGLSLNLTQLIKLVKFVPLNRQNHLQYQYVISKLGQTQHEAKQELTEGQFRKVIKEVLGQQKLPFSVPISVAKLTALLQSKYFKRFTEKQVLQQVRGIDLNQDEQIGQQDLNRYRQLIRDHNHKILAPIEIQQLLIRLREKSIKKKISYYDLFRKLQKSGSGFINRQSWLKNIPQILPLSSDQKQNLFNFMDKTHSSVIDYKTFLTIMNGNSSPPQAENFDWAQHALAQLKTWYHNSQLTLQDAFKVIDRDGDTYLSQQDIHTFLIDKLDYKQRQLSSVRIQKLSKLMDHYKHGRITFIDWQQLLTQNRDWLAEVKQQIGIVLSKHYPSLSDAFTTITSGDKKLLLVAFDIWARDNHVLSGFMPNQDILKHVFTSLDKHKKGYLTQTDFVALFGTYDWKAQHTKQVIDFLRVKFPSPQDAYKFMAGYGNQSVDFTRFSQVAAQFFSNRFTSSDLRNVWANLAGGNDTLNLAQFKKLHAHLWKEDNTSVDKQYPKDSWQYQDFSIIKGTTGRSNQHQYQQRQKMEQQCTKFINNLKDILASSPKTLQQAFSEVDQQKTGRVTNLMFKKAFRLLNIALTSKQIDLLLNYCEFQPQTLIDWRQFAKQLAVQQDKQLLRKRLQPKVQHISDLLHYYMISPKDAFRKWNNPRSGYMSFEQFYKMMAELYSQAKQPLPQYQQLEDLFQFIDIRRDNQLDFQQFTQVFRSCNPPNLLMGTTPAPADQIISKTPADKEANLPVREKTIPLFRHSPVYQQFVQLIGRNRRYLQEEIEKSNEEKTAFIPFGKVEKVIREFAGKHGMQVEEGMVRNLIAFAMTGEKVDYQLLVSKFKDLSVEISEFPKRKVF